MKASSLISLPMFFGFRFTLATYSRVGCHQSSLRLN